MNFLLWRFLPQSNHKARKQVGQFLLLYIYKIFLSHLLFPFQPLLKGQILDKETSYSLNPSTLLDDLDYFNEQDRNAVQEVKETFELNRLLADRLGNNEVSDRIFDIPGIDLDLESDLELKSLKLSKRFYQVPTVFSNDYFENFPDLDKLEVHFHQNIDTFLRVTMMWGIGYSRLNDDKKSDLLIRYYSEEAENTFFRICQRCKLVGPLGWLKKNN